MLENDIPPPFFPQGVDDDGRPICRIVGPEEQMHDRVVRLEQRVNMLEGQARADDRDWPALLARIAALEARLGIMAEPVIAWTPPAAGGKA